MDWWIVKTGCDGIVLEFVKNNAVTLSSVFAILLAIAKLTKSEWDDRLIEAIKNPFVKLFSRTNGKPPPVE